MLYRLLPAVVFLTITSIFHASAQDAQWLTPRRTSNPSFQYTPSPSDWRDINMYQLFTDRFADGDDSNNPRSKGWYVDGKNFPQNRNFHHGGDWKGLKNNLDYLSGMGVRSIWISGVQMNDQGKDKNYTPYHMYHPTDFFRADPVMGTFQDLKELIDAAHQRGIYVILDVVINHTADKNGLRNGNDDTQYFSNGGPNFGWWNDNNKHAWPFDDLQYFHRNGTINNWDSFPEYIYGQFKGTDDLATENEYVKEKLTDIFKNLIDATDCDGFRVDAIKHVDEQWIKKWADDMRKHAASLGKNDFLLFGEYFTYDNNTLARYCKDSGYSFNSALFFPMSQTIKNVFVDNQWTGQLTQALSAKSGYGEGENRLVTFIDNHDVNRIALYISQSGDANRINQVMGPALTFLYTATPVPCLYYGTEQGFNQGGHYNGSNRTQDNPDDGDWQRETMFDRGFQPGLAQGNKLMATNAPLYQHIKKLNAARAASPALTRGNFVERWQTGGAGPFAFTRTYQDQEALVAFNTSENQQQINPVVGKPEGTQYTNVLNPSEKVSVSGGKLTFNLGGKESKVFVAGAVNKPSEARLTVTANDITITYTPNDGPLKTAAKPVQIGIKVDGGAETFVNMTELPDKTWSYTRARAGITTSVAVKFRDSAATPAVDNTGGASWTFDATGFDKSDVAWTGNTTTWPLQGNITSGDDIWVDYQTYPQGAATSGKVIYTTDGGKTWKDKATSADGQIGNNDKWHVNLGKFPSGTTLRFSVQAKDKNGNSTSDNNGGQDYSRTIQAGTIVIGWYGGTYHWPLAGEIESTDSFWVNIQTYPAGACVGGEVVYTTRSDDTGWSALPLSHDGAGGPNNQNDVWHVNLGKFSPGSTIRFAVKVTDTTGVSYWDNNGGANFSATVNGSASSIAGFDQVGARGTASASGAMPKTSLSINPSKKAQIDISGRDTNTTYYIQKSADLKNWENVTVIDPQSSVSHWTMPEDLSAGARSMFYRVKALDSSTEHLMPGKPATVSIRSYPPGSAKSAKLVFSTDGGATWWPAGVSMNLASTGAEGDIWNVQVPTTLQIGDVLQFAIELKDENGASVWANNGGKDYKSNVVNPNQTDFDAPTISHSPENTTTSASTLSVTLSATDNADPAPKIYYTTDGSAPTTGSLLYTGPILVTDKGTGVDMTIRYFAIDNQSNRSDAKTVEVRVAQTSNPGQFGPNKPYSVNPTLGKAVANGSITINGSNTGNKWTDDKLIAIGMANDDPRSLGGNWTMHEAPINLTHMWAAWDDTYLYVAWQYVDVTDVIDPANAGGAGSGRIGSNDGILQWIALDTKPGEGATKDMWAKNGGQPLWNGANKPDYQIYLAGSLWQGYISRAKNGVFPVDDGGVNYFTLAGAGITAGKGALFAGTSLWGVGDADDRNKSNAPDRNFLTQGHNQARDSFYEIKIPLTFLGITRAQLESQGIGIMIGAGSASCMDTLPQDDGATLDTPGTESYNSSFEWSDIDSITKPFARIGAW